MKIRYFFIVIWMLVLVNPLIGEWSIGIYRGKTPFQLSNPTGLDNPVLSAANVTDRNASFVADPFIIRESNTWYLFMEVLSSGRGEIGYATSRDGYSWKYQQIILSESFHLSYPYVFNFNGQYYMIPETNEANSIRLYRALEFPTLWQFEGILVDGQPFVDSSIVYYENRWWLFTSTVSNRYLYLYSSDNLFGPYSEHPASPVVNNNPAFARPGGRVIFNNGHVYRYAQDNRDSYGKAVRAIEITELTLSRYAESLVGTPPVVEASGFGWNRDGMHQVDPIEISPGQWIAAVDGNGIPPILPPQFDQMPQSIIDSPTDNISIYAGDWITFAGTGTDVYGNLPFSYHWHFGDPSISDAIAEDPGPIQFNTPGVYNVQFTVINGSGQSDPTPATVAVTVLDPYIPQNIPQTSWSVRYVDSQELAGANGAAVNAIDGNRQTIWHTAWSSGSAPLPHEIQIDLGDVYEVSGFRYLPRQDGELNGRIGQYEFYVSMDGADWESVAAAGTFSNDATEKEIRFGARVGRYVRLRALTEANGGPWTSMAELNVLGIPYYVTGHRVSGMVTRSGAPLDGVVLIGLPGNPTTNALGVYSCTVADGFSGTATPSLVGNIFTPPIRTYTNVTSDQTSQDYTAILLTYSITGTVTRGGVGLQNVVMSGLPGSPATNASGVYTATVDYGFSGTATPTLAGNTFTPPSRTYSNVTSNQTGQDYTATLLTYTISGAVTRGGVGLQNVVMSDLPGSPATNASGIYTATVDYGFSGTATPTLAGNTFTPPSRTYSNATSNQTGQDYTATLLTYTITGTVTRGGAGLQNVVMSGLPGSPATNASGVYTATVDYGFSGTATPVLAGYTFVPPSRTYSSVTVNQIDQDYAASTVMLSISGTVAYNGSGLQDVVISGLPGSPATNASGVYTATINYGFSETVTPTLTNYTFTPPSRTYSNVTSNQTGQDYTAALVPPPVILLSRSTLKYGATSAFKTSDQKFIISNAGSHTLDWSITDNAAWLSCSPVSGTGENEITVSLDQTGLAPDTYNAAITVSSTSATISPQTVNVTLIVMPASMVANPAGSFDTPADGTTGITGAIPVTGWALDDIEVTRVEIKRDPAAADPPEARGEDGLVFIGDAVFVEDARPDVEQAYPSLPLNYRAGWGYMLLTYGLPDQGNGSYKLYAFAHDKDGHRIGLGNKTIQCDNANATKPFGTIDTPNQGGTISGTYTNFGWVLTPMPNEIPRDGSTIGVYIDGVYVNHPVYNQYRADIATSFPGFANSDRAVGLYDIDTTQYANRVHTIGWLVSDNVGNTDGIGSRFFTVFNAASPNSAAQVANTQGLRIALSPEEILRLPARSSSVQFRQGASSAERWQLGRMNREGTNAVQIREVDRVEIQLGQSGNIQGFMVVGKDLRPLPAGSTLDGRSGTFYWQPGPGFKGDYNFIFIGENADGKPIKTSLTVTIAAKSHAF